MAELPRPGETILASRSFRGSGGKGANQAIGAALAGANVRMFGAVGDDADGAMLRDQLCRRGLDLTGLATCTDAPTGTAIIALSDAGENCIIVSPGANLLARAPEPAALVGCTVALAQLETPVGEIEAFFKAARAAGALTILNTAPAVPASRGLLNLVDIFVFNEVELASYIGTSAPPRAARSLLTHRTQRAVVTLGARGAVLVDAASALHVPASTVTKVVDTTGAGDRFCGTLAALVERESNWRTILETANAAAAHCVEHEGAVPAL
ncbi:MAG: ribokinase [Alphaproteobacteria bacterium]|nr:ribokinase [Alphaproteobacteria bacterium]MBU0795443.1 ribokinase [Alphaproteobacteria bacterium]MBU0876602.1 ribokinase [Alphaproteobacteria bacterium]MBU1769303.1 ribokinase [Alphaproteobacteria bacterium]